MTGDILNKKRYTREIRARNEMCHVHYQDFDCELFPKAVSTENRQQNCMSRWHERRPAVAGSEILKTQGWTGLDAASCKFMSALSPAGYQRDNFEAMSNGCSDEVRA
jgi:hypothetical protein